MDISRKTVEKPRFIEVEKFVESRTNSIAQLLKAIDNDALVTGEVTKGPRTAAQRLPRHMRRRAMAYDIRRFPKTMREFAAAHLISNHAKKCPSRFARRKSANSRNKFGRSTSSKGIWMPTHIWHAKRFRMIERWGFKIADRSFQRGFRSILRDSNENCVVRDRSYYTCLTIKSADAYSIMSPFSQPMCRKQSSCGEEEECHQLYIPGQYPFGYIGPSRYQKLNGENSSSLYVWIHPSSKLQLLTALIDYYNLEKQDDSEVVEYRNAEIVVSVDSEHLSRFHLSGPKCLSKLRDSIRLISDESFLSEHDRFLKSAGSVFTSTRDGEVFYLLIEDPRTCFDRKPATKQKTSSEPGSDDITCIKPNKFWNREVREESAQKRMKESDFQKRSAMVVGTATSTDAAVPIVVIIRNEGLNALDGADILVPEPFSKDLWISLQRRGVRASGLRDEYAAHRESETLYYPLDDVESDAGKESQIALKNQMSEKYLSKPHNRRCKFWSYLSVKYPFEFQWNELVKDWSSDIVRNAFVCRDLKKLRAIEQGLRSSAGLPEETQEAGMLIPIKVQFIGRGRPNKFGMICLPTNDDLILIQQNRNREIIQTAPGASSDLPTDEPMELEEVVTERKELHGFVSLDAAASEKPINLKWLFEESVALDDRTTKRKRANRKKKEAKKRTKLEFETRVKENEIEDSHRQSAKYRFSSDREIIGRIVAGEQSVLAGHGVGLGYICANVLPRIASNYHKAKTLVLVRNSTSKYYHPAYVTVLKNSTQI